MGHYDECRPGYCAACGAAPGNMRSDGTCEFCHPEPQAAPTTWWRHRFRANLDDPRPVTFPPPGPWWRTGYGESYSTVVAYLPTNVAVVDYWPEASDIDSSPAPDGPQFTGRFPRPAWWTDELAAKAGAT